MRKAQLLILKTSIESTAAKGKFSKDNKGYDREHQIDAAKVMASDSLLTYSP